MTVGAPPRVLPDAGPPAEARAPADAVAPSRAPRAFRRVEHIMGTAITVDVREGDLEPGDLDAAFARLREVDERFSTYRPASEISRLLRGDIREHECSPDVGHVLALCDDLHRTSGGYFDARGHRTDGGPDPTGVVKGWAVEEAAWLIAEAGADRFAINAGGDIVVRGGVSPDEPWRVGIRHPRIADRVAAVVRLRDAAIATSGAYERGEHIVDPHTGRPPRALLAVSVIGPSLTYADAYATAAFAMGMDGPAWVASHPGYGAFAVTADERVLWTPEVDPLLDH